MERGIFEEKILDQLRIGVGIDHRARTHNGQERYVALKDEQRAGIGRRHIAAGLGNLADRAGHIGTGTADVRIQGAAHALQQPAQFRLEKDDQRDDAQFHGLSQDITEHDQPEEFGRPQRDQHQNQALGEIDEAGFPNKPDDTIYKVGNDDDVNEIGDPHRRQIVSGASQRIGNFIHGRSSYPCT